MSDTLAESIPDRLLVTEMQPDLKNVNYIRDGQETVEARPLYLVWLVDNIIQRRVR